MGTSNLVEGGQAYINLAYTHVLLDRLRNGGSVEPHPILVEEVCSGNAAALGADELQQAERTDEYEQEGRTVEPLRSDGAVHAQ